MSLGTFEVTLETPIYWIFLHLVFFLHKNIFPQFLQILFEPPSCQIKKKFLIFSLKFFFQNRYLVMQGNWENQAFQEMPWRLRRFHNRLDIWRNSRHCRKCRGNLGNFKSFVYLFTNTLFPGNSTHKNLPATYLGWGCDKAGIQEAG